MISYIMNKALNCISLVILASFQAMILATSVWYVVTKFYHQTRHLLERRVKIHWYQPVLSVTMDLNHCYHLKLHRLWYIKSAGRIIHGLLVLKHSNVNVMAPLLYLFQTQFLVNCVPQFHHLISKVNAFTVQKQFWIIVSYRENAKTYLVR